MKPLEALQATLAGEHAAIYVYSVAGARTSESRSPGLFANLDQAFRLHRRRRDWLAARIVALGGTPVPAEVAYELPAPLASAADMTKAALQLERRLAVVYGQLVASTPGADRRWAIDALEDCAVRQLAFRGTPETFPGATS